MKESRSNPSRKAASPKNIATAAVALSAPLLFPASGLMAQKDPNAPTHRAETVHLYLKFADRFVKLHEIYSIIGFEDHHALFKNTKGEYFYIEPSTGNMKFLSPGVPTTQRALTFGREKLKGSSIQVTLVGVDAAGHLVQKNSRGELFYLHHETGDMVFVK